MASSIPRSYSRPSAGSPSEWFGLSSLLSCTGRCDKVCQGGTKSGSRSPVTEAWPGWWQGQGGWGGRGYVVLFFKRFPGKNFMKVVHIHLRISSLRDCHSCSCITCMHHNVMQRSIEQDWQDHIFTSPELTSSYFHLPQNLLALLAHAVPLALPSDVPLKSSKAILVCPGEKIKTG